MFVLALCLARACGRRRFDGGSSTWSYNASVSIEFQMSGPTDTAQQIQNIITTSGQFLTGSDRLVLSGLLSNAFRDGSLTAQLEAEALMALGNSSRQRILARVLPSRRVQLYAEPLISQVDYYIDAQQQLYDANLVPARAELCPAGVWCALHNVIPPSAKLLDPFFIEESTYDVTSGRWTPRNSRIVPNIYNLFTGLHHTQNPYHTGPI